MIIPPENICLCPPGRSHHKGSHSGPCCPRACEKHLMQMVYMHKTVELLDNFHDLLSFGANQGTRLSQILCFNLRKSGQGIVYQCNPGFRTFSFGLNQAPQSRREEGRGGFGQGGPEKCLDQYLDLDLANILDQYLNLANVLDQHLHHAPMIWTTSKTSELFFSILVEEIKMRARLLLFILV